MDIRARLAAIAIALSCCASPTDAFGIESIGDSRPPDIRLWSEHISTDWLMLGTAGVRLIIHESQSLPLSSTAATLSGRSSTTLDHAAALRTGEPTYIIRLLQLSFSLDQPIIDFDAALGRVPIGDEAGSTEATAMADAAPAPGSLALLLLAALVFRRRRI